MCMFDPDGGDAASYYVETNPIARKPHTCDECRREILTGEVYQRYFGVWDGVPSTYKTCAHCCVAQDWLRQECNGWLFGEVRSDMRDHAEQGVYGSGPARLVVGMSRKWRSFTTDALMAVPQMPEITAHA